MQTQTGCALLMAHHFQVGTANEWLNDRWNLLPRCSVSGGSITYKRPVREAPVQSFLLKCSCDSQRSVCDGKWKKKTRPCLSFVSFDLIDDQQEGFRCLRTDFVWLRKKQFIQWYWLLSILQLDSYLENNSDQWQKPTNTSSQMKVDIWLSLVLLLAMETLHRFCHFI